MAKIQPPPPTEEERAGEKGDGIGTFNLADLAALDRLWTDDFSVNSPHNVVGNKQRTLARRFTNLWRLEDGVWRCFARHANVVRREP